MRIWKLLFLAAALAAPIALTACNTVEGVGKDVQDAGAGMEGAAQSVGNELPDPHPDHD